MVRKLNKTVVFVGLMGSGKTAVGSALARRLDVPFADSDREIERAEDMTVVEMFERFGEAWFREREARAIERLLESAPGVVATGGGAFAREEVRRLVAARAVSVWLRADVDLLWSRVRRKNTRPLLNAPDPYGTLERLAREREPAYARADVAVDASDECTAEEMAGRVLDALAARPGILEDGR